VLKIIGAGSAVRHGWEPLCSFLGADVPGQPFPHLNTQAGLTGERDVFAVPGPEVSTANTCQPIQWM
jgi:sulfotransferase family protein